MLRFYITVLLFISFTITTCKNNPTTSESKHVFFIHNRFLETHNLEEEHSEYGRVEYNEILNEFKNNGFEVHAEVRQSNVDASDYALKVKSQIDALINKNISASDITIIGTSKGGYIAQYVSLHCANPNLNFVFIGAFQESDIDNIPHLHWCGNILNIYESSDPFGVSALKRKDNSNLKISNFNEVKLNTGLGHGFLFKNLEAWTSPCIKFIQNRDI